MEIIEHLALGFSTAFTLTNLLYCFFGVLLGTMVGVLPGIGPTSATAMLLPVTFTLSPVAALIMLAGIYYGAQYGGSTTAILINLPGEASSVVTAIDGYQMARQGRAGPALAAAAIGSFAAGTLATILIVIAAPPLAQVAIKFGPADYFSLVVLGLVMSVALAHGSVLKALAMVMLGLLLGLTGTDIYTGATRFTFGEQGLADGFNIVSVAAGVFGAAEILRNLEDGGQRTALVRKVTGLMPTRDDLRRMVAPVLRGTVIGSLLGVLPGGGATLSSFAAYTVEKKMSRTPEMFGKGAIEGVAGPESANNAGAQTSFIPMLTLGIPTNPLMALMIGAMIVHGVVPGPMVANKQPELFWGLIASMWVGNVMLVILNLPLIGIWVRLLTVPYRVLFPTIIAFATIGVFFVNNNVLDIFAISAFGLIGYVLVKTDCEPAPLLLGFVLGPMLEEHLRRALLISRGDPATFLRHPISATLLVMASIALIVVILPAVVKKREEVFVEND